MAITQECCVQSSTSPGSNTPQDTNCTAICPLSRKLFKLGEPDMQDIAGEAEIIIRDVLIYPSGYIQQLCEDTGCCPEDLPRAMNDREEWRERVRDIRAASTIWWWWWPFLLSAIQEKDKNKNLFRYGVAYYPCRRLGNVTIEKSCNKEKKTKNSSISRIIYIYIYIKGANKNRAWNVQDAIMLKPIDKNSNYKSLLGVSCWWRNYEICINSNKL